MDYNKIREDLIQYLIGEMDTVFEKSKEITSKSDDVLAEFERARALLPTTIEAAVVTVTEVLRTETGHLLAAHSKTKELSQQALMSVGTRIHNSFVDAQMAAREQTQEEAERFVENLRTVIDGLKIDVQKTVEQAAKRAIDEVLTLKVNNSVTRINTSASELDKTINDAKSKLDTATSLITSSSAAIFNATFLAVCCSTSVVSVGFLLLYKFVLT